MTEQLHYQPLAATQPTPEDLAPQTLESALGHFTVQNANIAENKYVALSI